MAKSNKKQTETTINNSEVLIVNENSTSIYCMNFGDAIKALKIGKKVARKGWNGKGMFLYYVPAGAYAPCTEIAKTIVNKDGLVPYAPYIAIKTTDGYVVPWTASQTDILSDDWEIVDDNFSHEYEEPKKEEELEKEIKEDKHKNEKTLILRKSTYKTLRNYGSSMSAYKSDVSIFESELTDDLIALASKDSICAGDIAYTMYLVRCYDNPNNYYFSIELNVRSNDSIFRHLYVDLSLSNNIVGKIFFDNNGVINDIILAPYRPFKLNTNDVFISNEDLEKLANKYKGYKIYIDKETPFSYDMIYK